MAHFSPYQAAEFCGGTLRVKHPSEKDKMPKPSALRGSRDLMNSENSKSFNPSPMLHLKCIAAEIRFAALLITGAMGQIVSGAIGVHVVCIFEEKYASPFAAILHGICQLIN